MENTAKRITKRTQFNALLNLAEVKANPDLVAFIEKEIVHIAETGVFIDYKTALQQIVQQASGERLEYAVTSESGPDHDKYFEVEARLNSNVIGRGKGKNKRAAEQMAAKEALVLFGEVHE